MYEVKTATGQIIGPYKTHAEALKAARRTAGSILPVKESK